MPLTHFPNGISTSAVQLTGATLPNDPALLIPAGTYTSPHVFSVNKFGGGVEAEANAVTDVWDYGYAAGDAVYPYPATATITDLKQTAHQAAMVNAVIEVQGLDANWDLVVQERKGLDANWDLVVQERTLHGTDTSTKMELTTPLIRIFRMKVLADVVTDQNVTAMDTGAGVAVFAMIQAGNNQTLMALYTVPNGYTAYMTGYSASVTNETAANKTPLGTEVKLWASDRDNGYEFQLKHATSIAADGDNEHHGFYPYYKFTQKTDIKITMMCIAEPGHVHAGFDLIVVENT